MVGNGVKKKEGRKWGHRREKDKFQKTIILNRN